MKREAKAAIVPGDTLERRAIKKPTCFQQYRKAAQISSACSCLAIPTATAGEPPVHTVTTDHFVIKASYNQQYAYQKPFDDTISFTQDYMPASLSFTFNSTLEECALYTTTKLGASQAGADGDESVYLGNDGPAW